MTNANFDDEDDKPLDPVMERVRRKMIRLQVISAGTIVVSLMAVLGAVVYKASQEAGTDEAAAVHAPQSGLVIPEGGALSLSAILPAGFVMTGATLDGDRVLMSGTDAAGKPVLHVYDMVRGRVIASIVLETK